MCVDYNNNNLVILALLTEEDITNNLYIDEYYVEIPQNSKIL